MQDGDARVSVKILRNSRNYISFFLQFIAGSMKHSSLIDEFCRSHVHVQKSSYGQLVHNYGRMILQKLMFHNKNKYVPGNFGMKMAELENIEAGDMFELGVEFLDQMENTLSLMQCVFNSFEMGNKSVSLTREGQCRLAAMIPCIHDTSRLLELTTSLMRLLHLAVPWDALSGHRSRFGEIHTRLRKMYLEMTNIIFVRSMIQIPRLSEDLSIFFETLHTISMSEKAQDLDFEIQTFDEPSPQADELVSISGESVDASMAYIQQEYSDLSSKYQMVLQMLEAEQRQKQSEQEAHQAREKLLEDQLESLRQQFNEFSVASASVGASATVDSAEAAGKLEKLKAAYQKLRTDHITLLRQKGDLEKSLQLVKGDVERIESSCQSQRDTLATFFQRQQIDFSGDEGLAKALSELSEKLDTLQVSLLAKENALRALEDEQNKEQDNELDVDSEIKKMQDSISQAAATMEKLMVLAKTNEAKKKDIDVDIKILDSCGLLIHAIEVLIKAARELQKEITAESGFPAAGDFYRKNHKWSQGLVSAAKDIGSGAKCLVDTADGLLAGQAKFEELIVASQEITASTAQMVLASRVKARPQSEKLDQLSASSKSVAEATAKVIATCRACALQVAESEDDIDLMSLTVHQSKRLEMEVQIRVLELETLLEKQRSKLFAIRKHQYANAKDNETKSEQQS